MEWQVLSPRVPQIYNKNNLIVYVELVKMPVKKDENGKPSGNSEPSETSGHLCIKPLKVNCLSLPGMVIVVTICRDDNLIIINSGENKYWLTRSFCLYNVYERISPLGLKHRKIISTGSVTILQTTRSSSASSSLITDSGTS